MVPEIKNIRIGFEKTGKLKFISHLDLCRTMKTAMIRADIPVWYSEGYNPHPKMVFALPLSIGIESICELMDIRISEDMPLEEIRRRLNNEFTSELKITEIYTPQDKFSEIAWAEYKISYCGSDITAAQYLFKEPFIIKKRSKNGVKDTDARQYIRRYEIKEDKLIIQLSADSNGYLNPEYIASAVSAACGAADYEIMRLNLYKADGVTVFR